VVAIEALAVRISVNNASLLWSGAAEILTLTVDAGCIGFQTRSCCTLEVATRLLVAAQLKALAPDELQIWLGQITTVALESIASFITASVEICSWCTASWLRQIVCGALEGVAKLLLAARIDSKAANCCSGKLQSKASTAYEAATRLIAASVSILSYHVRISWLGDVIERALEHATCRLWRWHGGSRSGWAE